MQSSSIFLEMHEGPQKNNLSFHLSFHFFSVSLVFSQPRKILTKLSLGIRRILFLLRVQITEVLFSSLMDAIPQEYILKRVGKRHFSEIPVRLEVF